MDVAVKHVFHLKELVFNINYGMKVLLVIKLNHLIEILIFV
jgi:hypothetical protein